MNSYLKLFLFLVAISVIILSADYKFFAVRNFHKIHFLNVGQGDSILVRTKSNCNILVDGGGYNVLVDQLSKHLPPLSQQIDLLILSHPHLDHLGGLVQVLSKYRVNNIMLTGVHYNSNVYTEFLRLINQSDIKPLVISKSSNYKLCGIDIQTIAPNHSISGLEFENVNNSSIVIILTVGSQKIWLAGDAELEQEQEIIPELKQFSYLLPITIYKASHHGSRTSNSYQLLEILQPKIMVIQSGKDNTYKHPHFETLQTANTLGIKIYRNDLNGTITFLVR
jgi:competence protein ComEC